MAIRLRRRPRAWVVIAGVMSVAMLAVLMLGLLRPLPSYLVAAGNLQPGVVLGPEAFEMVELDLGALASDYASSIPAGQTVTTLIRAGELLPKSRLGQFAPSGLTSIRFVPESRPASATEVGTHVAIWQVVEVEEVSAAQLLVPRALVTAIDEPEGLFADASPEVELQLFAEQATLVIAALAANYPLFVLPTP